MKKILGTGLMLAMVFIIIGTGFAISEDISADMSIVESYNPQFTARMNQNTDVIACISSQNLIDICINYVSYNTIDGRINFSYDGNEYTVSAYGEITNYSGGVIGVLQGTQWINGLLKPITADFVSAENGDVFIIVNIGFITDVDKMHCLVYGEYTDAIESLYTQDAASITADTTVEERPSYLHGSIDSSTENAADEIIYLGGASINYNNLSFGELSVFHADQLSNQGYTMVFAKVNTNNSAVVDYIRNNYNVALDTVSAIADQFNIRIAACNEEVLAIDDSYLPKHGTTDQNIVIPCYNIKGKPAAFTEFNITTDDIVMARSTYGSAMAPNAYEWTICNSNGFCNTDGDEITKSGISVQAGFVGAGNISSSTDITVACTGSIRYLCRYLPNASATQMVAFHLTTDTASSDTTMRLVP